jgi:hypothetical protein
MTPCNTPPARPCGLRPFDPRAPHAARAAESFAGLPDGVTRWRLAAALRAAARLLDLSAPMLRLLEHYIDCTYDIDWTAGSEPVVTRPLTETATCLGRSERQIRNIERALAERGLLGWRDSGNHHRRGQRDRRTGRLMHAYGPTLSPLGARAAEILSLAAKARAELAELRRSRLAIGALRRRLRCAMAALTLPVAEMGQAEKLLRRRLPARLSLTELDGHREALRRLTYEMEAAITGAAGETQAKTTGQAEILDRPYTDTKTDCSIKEYPLAAPAKTARSAEIEESTLSTRLITHAAGPVMAAMLGERPDWPTILHAAERTASMVGLESRDWQKGCQRMGRLQAALAVLVMEQASLRPETGRWAPLRKPSAYFEGLVKRHGEGSLRLDQSIRRLAREGSLGRTDQPGLGYAGARQGPFGKTGQAHEPA